MTKRRKQSGEEADGLFDRVVDTQDEVGGTVEALKPTARHPDRVMIRVGGKVRATLHWSVIRDLGIEKGTRWTIELAEQVAHAVQLDKARRAAMRTLERRALSSGELIERLRRKGFDESTSRAIAAQLAEAGYIDDLEYGRAVLRELTRTKPAGPALMRQELRRKRIDRELIDRIVAEHVEETQRETKEEAGDEHSEPRDEIAQFVRRKLRTMSSLDEQTQARRIYGALARRGFDPQTCRDYVERFVVNRDLEDESAEAFE